MLPATPRFVPCSAFSRRKATSGMRKRICVTCISLAAPRERVRRRALRHLVETFFDGSAAQAVATLLDPSMARVSEDDLDQLAGLIAKVRKGGAS